VIDKPLYQNPLGGGGGQLGGATFRQEGDMGRYVAFNDPGQPGAGFSSLEEYLAAGNKLPEQQTPNDLLGVSNANFNVSPPGTLKLDPQATSNMLGGMFNVTPPSVPVSEQTPFLEGVSQDIFGNPNIIRDSDGNPLPSFTPIRSPGLPPPDPTGLQDAVRTVDPIVTGPQEIATQDATNPYDRVGQQLTGPNQDDILGTLKNIEQGIASLGQGGMNQSSFGGFNNNFGIGSFFPPYGGMYG
jgi:hypothetical protein